jgi:uncharacterized protein
MTWRINVNKEQTAAEWDPPSGPDRGAVFICAHGAGGNMRDRAVMAFSKAMTERGVGVVRFDFLYRARQSARPDRMPKLMACYQAVLDRVRAERNPSALAIGGRSMGGRAASILAAEGVSAHGLLLLAYPLHPPAQPQKLRTEHLPRITVPVLCINGTRDDFCQKPVMEQTLANLGANWRMLWLQGADHGFHVLKRSGRTDAEVVNEAADAASRWITTL